MSMTVRIRKIDVHKASSALVLGNIKILAVPCDDAYVVIEVNSFELSRLTRNGISYDRRGL